MIAEFYGLPGSGKTTLVNALLDSGEKCIEKKPRGKNIGKLTHLRHGLTAEFFGFARRVLRVYRGKPVKSAVDRENVQAMLRVYLIYMWERESGSPVFHGYDHGLVQFCASLIWKDYGLKEKALDVVEWFCCHMKDGARMIYTRNAQPEEIYERIRQRGEYRRILNDMSREESMELLRFQHGFFEAAEEIGQKYEMNWTVDTSEDVSGNTACLLGRMGSAKP